MIGVFGSAVNSALTSGVTEGLGIVVAATFGAFKVLVETDDVLAGADCGAGFIGGVILAALFVATISTELVFTGRVITGALFVATISPPSSAQASELPGNTLRTQAEKMKKTDIANCFNSFFLYLWCGKSLSTPATPYESGRSLPVDKRHYA